MIKSDKWIKRKALEEGLLVPFETNQKAEGKISYGLGSYGYDIRLAEEFKICASRNFHNVWEFLKFLYYKIFRGNDGDLTDPKNFDGRLFKDFKGEFCIIPPNSFVLGRSLEYIKLPNEVLAICTGKSTYARCGIIVNVTPLEPGWEGYLTISISNTSPVPVKVYANEGIAQLLFFESKERCEVSYSDRAGKYQGQEGIVAAKV